MRFQLVSGTPSSLTPTVDVILDAIIHRIIVLGLELSNDTLYSVKLNYSGHNHILSVTKNSAPFDSIACNNVQIPPRMHVIIKQAAVPNQSIVKIHSNQRVVEMGIDFSTDNDCRASIVNELDPSDGSNTDYLLLNDGTSIEKIEMGGDGWKVPPNTGVGG